MISAKHAQTRSFVMKKEAGSRQKLNSSHLRSLLGIPGGGEHRMCGNEVYETHEKKETTYQDPE
jgi:hypothetical protein